MAKQRVNRTLVEAEQIRDQYHTNAINSLHERLALMNKILYEYHLQIKDLQPIAHGSIIPHLQVCSAKGCLGCLHVRWKRWFDPQKEQRKRQRLFGKRVGEHLKESKFVAADISNPLQVLPRGDENAELREVVKAFDDLCQKRKRYVAHISNALKSTSIFDT